MTTFDWQTKTIVIEKIYYSCYAGNDDWQLDVSPNDMPDFDELRGRRVHLLGGSPRLQKDTLVKLQAVGMKVLLSVDGNSQFGAAEKGSAWIAGRWQRKVGEAVNLYDTQVLSSRNIQRELNASAEWRQGQLF